jgi:hypothetical protein
VSFGLLVFFVIYVINIAAGFLFWQIAPPPSAAEPPSAGNAPPAERSPRRTSIVEEPQIAKPVPATRGAVLPALA